MEEKTLTPIEQALVPFYAWVILAVRLPDGRIAASLTSLCRLLNLSQRGQIQSIRRDPVLANQLLRVVLQTPGGPQTIDVLTAWAIPLWLTGLNPEMVAPEKRPLIMALRQEAADVLYRYFFKIGFDQASRRRSRSAPCSLVNKHERALAYDYGCAGRMVRAGDRSGARGVG